MNWKEIADIVRDILEVLVAIPFCIGLFFLFFSLTALAIAIIYYIIRFPLKIFGLDKKVEKKIKNLLVGFVNFIKNTKTKIHNFFCAVRLFIQKVVFILKIASMIIIPLLIYLLPFILNHCTGSHSSYQRSEEEIEDIMDDPQRHVPGRYRE